MIEKLDNSNRERLTRYNLLDFCTELIRLGRLGWNLENTNEGSPQGFHGTYSCVLVRDMRESEEVQPKSVGRPKKTVE